MLKNYYLRFFSILLIVLFMAIFAGAIFAGEANIIIKLGHIDSPNSPMGKGADRFAELVSSKSEGRMEVHVFPSEQLGPAPAQVQDVISGSLDCFLENPATFGQFVPAQKIHFLLYFFRSREHFRNCVKTELWHKTFVEPMEEIGVKTLATKWNWDRGPLKVIIANKPIIKPEDFKGIKLRMFDSDVAVRTLEHMGASIVIIPWSDIYLALKTGTVNALTAPACAVYPNKFTEVVKYITFWDQQVSTVNIHMNKAKFDSLSSEDQQILIDSANEAGEHYTDLVNEGWESDMQKMEEEHGAIFIKELDRTPWIKLTREINLKFEEEGLIPKFYDEFQKIPD